MVGPDQPVQEGSEGKVVHQAARVGDVVEAGADRRVDAAACGRGRQVLPGEIGRTLAQRARLRAGRAVDGKGKGAVEIVLDPGDIGRAGRQGPRRDDHAGGHRPGVEIRMGRLAYFPPGFEPGAAIADGYHGGDVTGLIGGSRRERIVKLPLEVRAGRATAGIHRKHLQRRLEQRQVGVDPPGPRGLETGSVADVDQHQVLRSGIDPHQALGNVIRRVEPRPFCKRDRRAIEIVDQFGYGPGWMRVNAQQDQEQ